MAFFDVLVSNWRWRIRDWEDNPRDMFDLQFFRIIRKILNWTEAPGSQYANEHESHLNKRNKTSFLESCVHDTLMMSLECQLLHVYVREKYPAYFGLTLHVGRAALHQHHQVVAM